MAKIKLTKANIDDQKASVKDIVYWDDALAVFFVLYGNRDGEARLRKYAIGPVRHNRLVNPPLVSCNSEFAKGIANG
jgi:hypothetical protein